MKRLQWRTGLSVGVMLLGVIVALVGAVFMIVDGQNYHYDLWQFPATNLILPLGALIVTIWYTLAVCDNRLRVETEVVRRRPFLEGVAAHRLAWFTGALLSAYITFQLSGNNTFFDTNTFFWLVAVGAGFWSLNNRPLVNWRRVGQSVRNLLASPPQWSTKFTVRIPPTYFIFAVIMLTAIAFRFYGVSAFPPELDSDHVEELRDVQAVLQGARPIFFPNNSGREAIHYYYLAILHQIAGIPLSFALLKIGDSLLGLLLIPLMWWAGRAIFGEISQADPEESSRQRTLGNTIGLIAAAFVATSFWHTMLSRAGLRIVLMTVITVPVVVFLVRGMRHNRRIDWVLSGLFLGISLYTYQAARILPLVCVAGFLLALAYRARSVRALTEYALNFGALVIMSVLVFAPLARYMVEEPNYFWARVTQRVLIDYGTVAGEDAVDIAALLKQNASQFGDNMSRTLLMFNWRGESTEFYGTPNGTAQLDAVAGAFLLIGVGMFAVRTLRRRDPSDLLLLISVFILILPSMLNFTNRDEVPSAIRTSGAVPIVYLIAAFAAAICLRTLWTHFTLRTARIVVISVGICLWVCAAATNWHTYFVTQAEFHYAHRPPYRQMGTLMRNFINSTGTPGNVFLMGYPYSWDHRAVGIEAGAIGWDNGINPEYRTADFMNKMRDFEGTRYTFRPDRQVMVFLRVEDADGLLETSEFFPGGKAIRIRAYRPERDFIIYVAPPVGCPYFKAIMGFESRYCDLVSRPQPSGER
ncbi:MAG: hypothetical protein OHK0023_22510 [Anaerolineae bacterium]